MNASRLENDGFKPKSNVFPLNSFLNKTIEDLRKTHPSAVFNVDSQLDCITADTYMIETIFNNLLENALKYSGEAAQIEVSVQQRNHICHIVIADQDLEFQMKKKTKSLKNSIGLETKFQDLRKVVDLVFYNKRIY